MSTCKTCAWWGEGRGPWWKPEMERRDRDCACPKFIILQDPGDPEATDHLILWDWEGQASELCTGPDFGCVHHEERA